VPEITVQEMCAEMIMHDIEQAERHAFLKENGFTTQITSSE
jgi:GDPmannose 4,6-dehydratase